MQRKTVATKAVRPSSLPYSTQILPANGNIYLPRNDISIYRSYTVEIPLNNVGVGAQNPFLLNEFLQTEATGSVIYMGLEAWTVNQQDATASGRAVVSNAEAAKLAVTFKWGQKEIIYLAPYVGYVALINFGMIRRLDQLQFSLSDSYIQVLSAGIAANKSALMTFYFKPVTRGR